MEALNELRAEHSVIERVLDGLAALVEVSEQSGVLEPEDILPTLAFFDDYVDGLHQDKEEKFLFPRLGRRLGREQLEELEQLFKEHQSERALLTEIRESVSGAAYGDRADLRSFVAAARSYINLQRQHIRYENRHLMPLAKRTLLEGDEEKLLKAFHQMDGEQRDAFRDVARRVLRPLESKLGRRFV